MHAHVQQCPYTFQLEYKWPSSSELQALCYTNPSLSSQLVGVSFNSWPGLLPSHADKTFDLVYSSDVLEHISPEEVDAAVAEMVRVARKHIVLSISLKSHMNERLHTMLRPRQWWEAKFQTYGGAPDRTLVWALQDKDT